MAKFKRNNLELKTNQKIFLGNSKEVEIRYTGSDLLIDSSIRIPEHIALGNQATVDQFGPKVLNLNENFTSGDNGGIGLSVNINSDVDSGTAWTIGALGLVQTPTTLHNTVQGGYFFANCTGNGLVVTDILGVQGGVSSPADNSTITNMIGGKFGAGTGYSMSNANITNMMAGRFQVLDFGSGDVSVENAYGLLVLTPGYNPSGTTENLYGLHVQDQSTVGFTNHFNIFSAGVGSENKFEGNVEIDGTLNVDTLDSTAGITVLGNISADAPTEDTHLATKLYVDTESATPNPLEVGVDDVTKGTIIAYGGSSAPNGGEVRVHCDATQDAVTEYYHFRAYNDDLFIGPNWDIDSFVYEEDGNFWGFRNGLLRVGHRGFQQGILYIEGHEGGLGGEQGGWLQIMLGDDYDASLARYDIMAWEDDMYIGPADAPDALKYDRGNNRWEFTHKVQGPTPTLDSDLATKLYVDNQIAISADDSYVKVVDDGTAAGYIEIVADGEQVASFDAEAASIRLGKESSAGKVVISDTSVEAHHAGTKAFQTTANGFDVYDTQFGNPTIIWRDQFENQYARMQIGTGGAIALTRYNGSSWDQGINITSDTTELGNPSDTSIVLNRSTNVITMKVNAEEAIVATADAGVDLYHAGVKVFETDTTGIIVTGDIYCDDLFTSGDTIHVGSGMIKSDSGNVELYHGGINTIKTNEFGVTIQNNDEVRPDGPEPSILFTDSTSELGWIWYRRDTRELTIDNRVGDGGGTAGTIKLISYVASQDPHTLLLGDPEGSVDLYYNGVKSLETEPDGIRVYDTSGDDTAIKFYDSAGTLMHKFVVENKSTFKITPVAASHSSNTIFQVNLTDDSGNSQTGIIATGDDAVDLYFDGNKRAGTNNFGMSLYAATQPSLEFYDNGLGDTAAWIFVDTSDDLKIQPQDGSIILDADQANGHYVETLWGNDGTKRTYHFGQSFYPSPTNNLTCGKSGNLWSDIYAQSGSVNTSDERAKENIIDTDLGLDFINRLNPISYKFKDENYEEILPDGTSTVLVNNTYTRTHYGLIAQDVKDVLDDIGKTSDEFAGYIHDPEADFYGLRYHEFIAPIIKAIQELGEDRTVRFVTEDSTAASGITIVNADSTTTIELIAAVNAKVTIKNVSVNAVTIQGSGTIDGQTSYTLSNQYDSLTVVCDGTDWYII